MSYNRKWNNYLKGGIISNYVFIINGLCMDGRTGPAAERCGDNNHGNRILVFRQS